MTLPSAIKPFMVAALLAASITAHAAPPQSIALSGQIVADNSFGTLAQHIGRNFNFEASFELDVSKAINTWVNAGGWTVYELDDGGANYAGAACIFDGANVAGGDCFSSNVIGFEFNDNAVENWTSEVSFLNINVADGTPLDVIVLGFDGQFGGDNTEVWVSLLFDGDLFDGYEPSGLPQSISLDKYVGGGGEFAQWDGPSDDWKGWAQFRVEAVSVSPVPEPAAAWMYGAGLFGLAAIARRRAARGR
ncbi:MAG: hypothetical protein KDE68_13495 [Rhodocyclaceae bacterium]|nr:hypothetical protein [Rhodocyclaceae bacterium]